MTSANFSGSLLSALLSLASTQAQLSVYQKQMSSGLRVGSASDDPVAWAAATRVTAQSAALDGAQNSLAQAASVTGVAAGALTNVLTILEKMKTDVMSASQSSNNVAAAEADIASQQQALISAISTASYDNVNLLDGSSTNPSYTTSFTKTSAGRYIYSTTTVDTTNTVLTQAASAGGLLGTATGASTAAGTAGTANGAGGAYSNTSLLGFSVGAGTSAADYDTLIQSLTTAIDNVTAGAASVGSVQSAVTNQKTYAASLKTTLETAASNLVDADMNNASTKLSALQTQEQLSIQALSIANQNSALVLRLFGL